MEPPPRDRYHLETDASVNRASPKRDGENGRPLFRSGGGVVLRDRTMRPFEEHSISLSYLPSVSDAERAALLWGLRRAAKLGIARLRVRNDNLPLIQALNRARNEPNYIAAPQLSEVVRISTSFESIEFRWARSIHSVRRVDGAHSADFLARRACGLGPRSY